MKKIILTTISIFSTCFLSISQCFAFSSGKAIDESREIPYFLIVFMIGTFIWMAYLYYIEHHD